MRPDDTLPPGPLSGIRVVDLTSMISGPVATMMLADQGADVIKVEAPQRPDHTRHVGSGHTGMTATFVNNNRNKRSIVLDLKTAEGLEALRAITKGADVFIQNMRPGAAEKLGFYTVLFSGPSQRRGRLTGWGLLPPR